MIRGLKGADQARPNGVVAASVDASRTFDVQFHGGLAMRLLVAGGTVFDGEQVLGKRDVLLDDDRIVEVAPEITTDADRFEAEGMWVTPGFVDMHVHLWNLGMEVLPALVGNGVTTVRDLGSHWTMADLGIGGHPKRVRQIKTDIECGKVVGPNVIYSGPMLHQLHPHMHGNTPMRVALARATDDPGSRPLESAEEAREAVAALIDDWGVGSIKIYESVRKPIAEAILEAAAGRVPVTGHLGLTSSIFAMEHGIGGMEHIHQSPIRDIAPPHRQIEENDWLAVQGYALSVLRAWADVDLAGPEVERWLRTLVDTGSFLDPTVSISSARPGPADPRRALFPAMFPDVPPERPAGGGGDVRGWAGEEVTARARDRQRGFMRLIHEHGGDLVVGTDLLPGALPGWGHHAEMVTLQRRGLAPIDVLRATTSVSAKHLWRDDLGRIAAGKLADLVILSRDPTEDVANVVSITHVVKSGVLYESARLLELAPGWEGNPAADS